MAARILPQDFYVYIHRRKSDGEVFYVGKGTGNRAWGLSGRNVFWKRIAKKHGWYVEIVQDGLQEWYAFELEADFILRYNRVCLANLTDGGGGVSGLEHTPESRQRMSKAHTGKVISAETRKRMSLAHMGRSSTERQIESARNIWKGKKLSDEQRQRLSEAHKGIRLSEEAKKKLSLHFRGRKHREEDKLKISEAAKRRREAGVKKKLTDDHKDNVGLAMQKVWEARRQGLIPMPTAQPKNRSDAFKEKMRQIANERWAKKRMKQQEQLNLF